VRPIHWIRLVGNLANGSTLLGLILARLGRAKLSPGPEGLILAGGYRFSFPRAGAFTVGNVILTAHDWDDPSFRSPGLLRHEGRHSWQYFALLGIPFLPLYVVAVAWSWLRTGDFGSANVFERLAGLELGGYARIEPANQGLRKLLRLPPS
jgi:hypothetical protein